MANAPARRAPEDSPNKWNFCCPVSCTTVGRAAVRSSTPSLISEFPVPREDFPYPVKSIVQTSNPDRANEFIMEYSPRPGTVKSKPAEEVEDPCTRNKTGSADFPACGAP